MNRTTLWLFSILPLLFSCNSNAPKPKAVHCQKYASLPTKYAKGFSVDYYDGFKVVTLHDVKDSSKIIVQYLLRKKGKPSPVGFEKMIPVDFPVHKIVCISTTHIAAMNELGISDSIAAVTNSKFIFSKDVRKKVDSGIVADVGGDNAIDFEKIVELAPTFIMTYGNAEGDASADGKLESMGQTVVMNFDYMEQYPLARAEWLKFTAAFFDMEDVADSLFKKTETEYYAVKETVLKAASYSRKPRVFCNTPFKNIWYMPCGENFMCQMIRDAGGDFIWANTQSANGLNLSLDYEAVFSKAHNADIWLLNSSIYSMYELKSADDKNKDFDAFKKGDVYNYDFQKTPKGGLDFWESGTYHPERVLLDLATIFYPDHFDHKFYYYRKLQ